MMTTSDDGTLVGTSGHRSTSIVGSVPSHAETQWRGCGYKCEAESTLFVSPSHSLRALLLLLLLLVVVVVVCPPRE